MLYTTQDVLAHATQDVVGCYSNGIYMYYCAAGTSAYQIKLQTRFIIVEHPLIAVRCEALEFCGFYNNNTNRVRPGFLV